MNTDIATLTFGIINDLVNLGRHPEDGSILEGLAHYIVGEAPDGRRFAHNATAVTRNGYAEDDMTVERLERLADYLNANHPSLDADCWTEVQASYGSAAYASGGWEARSLSSEIGAAVDAGEITSFEADSIRVGCGLLS